MFDILAYLYETYYRPDVLPEPATLAKNLSEIGFRESEIKDALLWLTDLVETTEDMADQPPQPGVCSFSQRFFAEQEQSALGADAIGFIRSLEFAQILDPALREIVIERSLAAKESPMSLETLRLIVLVVLWSQGEDPDELLLNTLFPDAESQEPRLLH